MFFFVWKGNFGICLGLTPEFPLIPSDWKPISPYNIGTLFRGQVMRKKKSINPELKLVLYQKVLKIALKKTFVGQLMFWTSFDWTRTQNSIKLSLVEILCVTTWPGSHQPLRLFILRACPNICGIYFWDWNSFGWPQIVHTKRKQRPL